MTPTLESVQYQSWDHLDADLMRSFRWYWCDLDGQHAAEVFPAHAPVTTHIWGWSAAAWVRLRVDGDCVVGAILRDGESPPVVGVPASVTPSSESPQRRPSGGVELASIPEFGVRTRTVFEPVRLTFVELFARS